MNYLNKFIYYITTKYEGQTLMEYYYCFYIIFIYICKILYDNKPN